MASSSKNATGNPGLERTLSGGRNRKRADSIREALGGNPLAIPPTKTTSYHLVACLIDGKPDWDLNGLIFCDAMGMAMALKGLGVGGTFLSCFDLDGYMFWLNQEKKIQGLAFGMTGPERKPIFVLDNFRTAKSDNLFEFVNPREMERAIFAWIKETAKKAVPGDVVNIILESHGHQTKGLVVGEMGKASNARRYLSIDKFCTALEDFKAGVQVNAINPACNSGAFVDAIKCRNPKDRYIHAACGTKEKAWSLDRSISGRIRGSRFELAWVMSLARLPIPGIQSSEPSLLNMTVKDHEDYIRNTMHAGFSQAPPQNPQSWSSCQDPQAIAHMLVRDKIDIRYDPVTTARRRRIEWPSLNPEINGILSPISNDPAASPAATKSAEDLLAHHVQACQPNNAPEDIETFDPRHFPFKTPQKIANALKLLYYRARQQSTIFDVFIMLNQRGFVGLDGLRKPYNLHVTSNDACKVGELIRCFDFIQQDENTPFETKPCPMWHDNNVIDYAQWLASMIIRDTYGSAEIFETIQASQYLGGLNEVAFTDYIDTWGNNKEFSRDPNDCVEGGFLSPSFGWWLPQNLGESCDVGTFHKLIYGTVKRFNDIERVFKDYFGIPNHQLLTEFQQASYIEQNRDSGRIQGSYGQYLNQEAAFRRASDARNSPDNVSDLPRST